MPVILCYTILNKITVSHNQTSYLNCFIQTAHKISERLPLVLKLSQRSIHLT